VVLNTIRVSLFKPLFSFVQAPPATDIAGSAQGNNFQFLKYSSG
jgi:hypothetical protein